MSKRIADVSRETLEAELIELRVRVRQLEELEGAVSDFDSEYHGLQLKEELLMDTAVFGVMNKMFRALKRYRKLQAKRIPK